MTAMPQIAKDLIGAHRIADVFPMRKDYRNRVWRVVGGNQDRYIVKRFDNRIVFENELIAVHTLNRLGLPCPEIHSTGGLTVVYLDSGGRDLRHFGASAVRQAGFALRRLHDVPGEVFEETALQIPTQPNQARIIAERNGYPHRTGTVWCHGDFHPGNILFDGNGQFLHMIDFEDFAPGDPLADLAIGCVEFASHRPNEASRIIGALCGGYFDTAERDARFEEWQDPEIRLLLVEAAFQIVESWARANRRQDLITWYAGSKPAILKAIA
ncbi:phosphotransferase enzyme family protein [Aestuariispira insulae]|uniref:Phosphotransferase family enzyme n=1 Tax=Aestuariispira insulae TaxID=1461337 RepID=A0A3D9H5D4_9PROT|nr:aminoglycoside phosphotransferase family protein [Aestuariispira insulae]RED44690.1 phosphotransferase family enzyme [Aestuariispira insulae]